MTIVMIRTVAMLIQFPAAYCRPGAAVQNANDAIRDYLIHLRKKAEQ